MTEVSFAKTFLTTLDSKTTKYQPDHTFNPAEFDLRIPFTLPKLQHPQHPSPPSLSEDASSSSTAAAQKPPGAEPATTTTNTINVTLTSSRNPNMTYTLPSAPPNTTVASIKQQIHEYLGGGATVASIDKIKILHNKKPIPASKATIADVVGDSTTKNLELSVMVLGGAPDPPPQQQNTSIKARAPEAAGPGSENAAVEAVTGQNPADTQEMEGVQQTTSGKSESIPIQPGDASGSAVLKTEEFWSDLEGFLAQRIRSQEEATKLRQLFEKAWKAT